MRISNLHSFTENHRYVTYREFSLSGLDRKMLSHVYQPIVGAFAMGMYELLCQHTPADKTGYAAFDTQRRLFLLLGLDLGEKGRSFFIEQASRLEAVGLLNTSRILFVDSDDCMYEYELQQPLSPQQFFATPHLALLLRDKVGKYAILAIHEQFALEDPFINTTIRRENISVPFYELFRLNARIIDHDFEQTLQKTVPTRTVHTTASDHTPILDITYVDIIARFPKQSCNRKFVEQLRYDKESMGTINYVKHKFELTLLEVCRLLDEDHIFEQDGTISLEQLQHRAHLNFRQSKRRNEKRERVQRQIEQQINQSEQPMPEIVVEQQFYVEVPPQLQQKCDVHQYNMLLRNMPYTQLLEKFFPGSVPDTCLDIFTKMDLNYKLPDEVINILIHYLMTMLANNDIHRLSEKFVEAIVSNLLVKQVYTYEQAVMYIRQQAKMKTEIGRSAQQTDVGKKTRGRNRYVDKRSKPVIPIVQPGNEKVTLSPEELERARELARQLDEERV